MVQPGLSDALPDIVEATHSYEGWLRRQLPVVEADLHFKHQQMAAAPFPFMRATFYRWTQVFPVVCRELVSAPSVLAIGDVHSENFGTWRDAEGRLIWGLNDADEAWPLPYTNDLVRLATSTRLAADAGVLRLPYRRAAAAILEGYRDSLRHGGSAFVLAENHAVLRGEAESDLRDPVRFWTAVRRLPASADPPAEARLLLRDSMPARVEALIVTRRAGLGSLGHQRLVAYGEHQGGLLAREVKAMAPSAVAWMSGRQRNIPLQYDVLLRRAVRATDPLLLPHGGWLVRRLAPDCSRIEFVTVKTKSGQEELLRAMAAETANIHLGNATARIAEVQRDLAARPAGWLHDAARAMHRAVLTDFKAWRAEDRSLQRPRLRLSPSAPPASVAASARNPRR